jgi:predicted ATP-grasp superfamily ATP-dependent carboligase
MGDRIAIVGASVRAAAFSALRAGFAPVGIDLFADADLRQRAAVIRVEHYPRDLEAAAIGQDADGWIYTGGIENYPDLVDRVAVRRFLWGNAGAVLRAVRDPRLCQNAFEDAGIPYPPTTSSFDGLPTDGSWLVKPRLGSGGAGIRSWTGHAAGSTERSRQARRVPTRQSGESPGHAPGHFFQKRIEGLPCSAVFVGGGGRSVLLGATWQMVGTPWTGAAAFAYAGSLGPLEPQPDLDCQWERIGSTLVKRFALVGLFGVDAVLDGRTLWPIEVNPRYPASVEVLEHALDVEAMRLHCDACRLGHVPDRVQRAAGRWCGKAVLYAPTDAVVSPQFGAFAGGVMKAWPWPNLADVPEVGTPLRKGRPAATVLAEAPDEASLRSTLERRAEVVRRLLFGQS